MSVTARIRHKRRDARCAALGAAVPGYRTRTTRRDDEHIVVARLERRRDQLRRRVRDRALRHKHTMGRVPSSSGQKSGATSRAASAGIMPMKRTLRATAARMLEARDRRLHVHLVALPPIQPPARVSAQRSEPARPSIDIWRRHTSALRGRAGKVRARWARRIDRTMIAPLPTRMRAIAHFLGHGRNRKSTSAGRKARARGCFIEAQRSSLE
jgi:hypothetical protein